MSIMFSGDLEVGEDNSRIYLPSNTKGKDILYTDDVRKVCDFLESHILTIFHADQESFKRVLNHLESLIDR